MSDIVSFVQEQRDFFVNVSCDKAVTWERESQFAIQHFQRNDTLARTALTNKASAQNAIINVSAIGVTLNPASKHAYLIPRDGAVHLDISYLGLIHLAMSAGVILWCQCKLVHEADKFTPVSIDKPPMHEYQPYSDRGAVVGGYCCVKTIEGDYLTEIMTLAEIEDVRKVSKAGFSPKGPWVLFWSEMARKTIIKRASKYWPRSERVEKAIDVLNQHEGLYTEPTMSHTPEAEIIVNEANRNDALEAKVDELCDLMEGSESMFELKSHYQTAFRLTRSHRMLNQKVQAVYHELKVDLEEVGS